MFSNNFNDVKNNLRNKTYNYQCIFVQNFNNTVEFRNLVIQNNYALNQPLVLLKSYDSDLLRTNNLIIFTNISVAYNYMEVSERFYSPSLIKIDSS